MKKKLPEKTAKELAAMPDNAIDYSDIPELDQGFMEQVALFRPQAKQHISLRLDADVIAWFKKQGSGYQSYMNAVLKAFVENKKEE